MVRISMVFVIIPFLLAHSDVKRFRGWSNVCLGGSGTLVLEELQLNNGTFTANSKIDHGVELQISWSGNWMRNCDTLVLLNIKETNRSAIVVSPFMQTDFENGNLNKEAVASQLESFISIQKAHFIVRGDTVLKIIKGKGVKTALVEAR